MHVYVSKSQDNFRESISDSKTIYNYLFYLVYIFYSCEQPILNYFPV